jgi:hypothetical protein
MSTPCSTRFRGHGKARSLIIVEDISNVVVKLLWLLLKTENKSFVVVNFRILNSR